MIEELELNKMERQLRHNFGKRSQVYQVFDELIKVYRQGAEQSDPSQCSAKTARGTQCSYEAKYCETHAKLLNK